ncbi:PQQ-binding-like beta-propeller repeat protein [Humisphaera borealis]|uniref:PQQ-like beta-propeller repeat protein n=1 Tax=Humisphaera borealis TaxID=2807512 RepID=A0A7M2WSR6_9BACT|nr:PQQ-binding-like beta-propeller repeat protein [Humisphaera borealis]QOV88565.1 PQQ-like beta-propeller repeat protein [Humisphaera borealis]
MMTSISVRRLILSGSIAFGLYHSAQAADWTMFRGPTRDGVVPAGEKAPAEWSASKNVKWKTALPRPGNASPVVVGGKVFLTLALDDKGTQRSLSCFDRTDGKQLWIKTVIYDTPEKTHGTNPYCAASPAADKDVVIAWHASAGLVCYDHDGKELWKRDLGPIRHIWGWAGSPVIHGDVVFLNAGPGDRQFVCAIDKKTGATLWQTEEPGGAEDKSPVTNGWLGSWGSPRVVDVAGKEQVWVFQSGGVKSYDPRTGKILWTVEGAGPLAYSDVYVAPAAADGSRLGLAIAGYGGAGIGFKVTADGAKRTWQNKDKHPQRIGTGVILGNRVIVPNEPYIGCYDLETGKEVWRQQFQGARFWGSIIQLGDRLYVTSQQGTTYVFAADPTAYKEIAQNPLGEASNSTPAVSDGQMFLRTAKHLWCVEQK